MPQGRISFDLGQDFPPVLSGKIQIQENDLRLRRRRVIASPVQEVHCLFTVFNHMKVIAYSSIQIASLVIITSTGLSSTNRISTGCIFIPGTIMSDPLFRYGEIKGCSYAKFGLHPNPSAMTFHDFFHYGKANARAAILASFVSR